MKKKISENLVHSITQEQIDDFKVSSEAFDISQT